MTATSDAPPVPAVVRHFAALDAWVHRGERALLCVVLTLMIAVVFIDFALRESGIQGLAWSKKAATYAMVWVGFLGSSLAVRGRKHLKVDASEKLIPRRFHPHVAIVVGFLAGALCLYLAGLGAVVAAQSFADGKSSPVMNFKMWIAEAAIPVACTLMGLRFLLRDSVGGLLRLLGKLPPEAPPPPDPILAPPPIDLTTSGESGKPGSPGQPAGGPAASPGNEVRK